MNLEDKKIAILVDNYFEQSEFEEPLKALKNEGAEVVIIGASKKDLQAMVRANHGDKFKADLLLRDANIADYDGLVLPGGALNADTLRVVDKANQWVSEFLDNNKPLAVICHAPWVLVSADIVESKRLTSFHTIKDDIRNAGGEWVDLPVVIDNNLITSRKPADLPMFNKALIAMLMHGPLSMDEELINSGAV